ncbi:UNVERIFIED_CONTAM: hypothetical protein K2H54_002698 [Gekko kuhli]
MTTIFALRQLLHKQSPSQDLGMKNLSDSKARDLSKVAKAYRESKSRQSLGLVAPARFCPQRGGYAAYRYAQPTTATAAAYSDSYFASDELTF